MDLRPLDERDRVGALSHDLPVTAPCLCGWWATFANAPMCHCDESPPGPETM